MKEIVIHASLDERAQWGIVLKELLPAFLYDGFKVYLRPRRKNAPCPAIWKDYMVIGYRSNPWELSIGTPNQLPTPGKRTVYFTKWSDSVNQMAVRFLNMAEVVILPSVWDRNRFFGAGVKRPVFIIPFGYQKEIFQDSHRMKPEKVIFGTTLNDQFPIVHGNFQNAFPNIDDVELWVRVFGDRTVPVDSDPRIHYFHGTDLSHWNRIQNWFKSLTCYVTLKDSGFGLSAVQAMACGVPVMGNAVGTKTQFLNEKTGYPILPETALSGTRQTHLCAGFRRIYLDRFEAFSMGHEASLTVKAWDQTYIHLWHLLKDLRVI